MENLKKVLASFGCFSAADIESVASRFKPVSLRKGDILLKEGEVCNHMWFVVSGCVILITDKRQQGKIIELFSKDYFFMESLSFMNDTPTGYHLEAAIDTNLLCISKTDYRDLDTHNTGWLMFRLHLVEKVCQYMTREIVSLKTRTNEERYNKLLEKRAFLFQLVPQYIIANYLDMTPVGLSKLRGRLNSNHRQP